METERSNGVLAATDLAGERAAPDLRLALMAAAGSLGALGGLMFAIEVRDGGRAGPVAIAAVVVAVGYLLLMGREAGSLPGSITPTAVVLVAAGAGAIPPLAMIDESTTSLSGVLALMTLLWAAAWLVPPTRGRPFLLGLALTGAWLFLVSVAADDMALTLSSPGGSNEAAYVSLMVGGALLAAAWGLDRSGRAAFATPFVAVGDIAAIVGATSVATDLGDVGGPVLVAAVGAALGVIGHLGGRRLTTWLGAALVGFSIVGLVGAVLDDDQTYAIAATLVGAGVVLAGVLIAVGRGDAPRHHQEALHSDAGDAPASGTDDADDRWARFAHPSPSSTGPVGEWRPDPSGRYAQRWWDGTAWTEHVADEAGRAGRDTPG